MLFDESREAQQLERSANGCFVDRLPGGLPGGAQYDFVEAEASFVKYLAARDRQNTLVLDIDLLKEFSDQFPRSRLSHRFDPNYYFWYGGLAHIPHVLSEFVNLRHLNLHGFGFDQDPTGEQAQFLFDLPALKSLSLLGSQFTQFPVPSRARALAYLNLAACPITDIDIEQIVRTTQLDFLNLSDAPITRDQSSFIADIRRMLKQGVLSSWEVQPQERLPYDDDSDSIVHYKLRRATGPELTVQLVE